MIGSPSYSDRYKDDLRQLDARASIAVWRDVKPFFDAQNLTDAPTHQYRAGIPNWLIQNERYGRIFHAGVSAKF